MICKSFAALAVAVALPALAASMPGAIALRIPCELPGVAGGAPEPTATCEHLSGWFEGRIDWIQNGTVLFSEHAPFLALRASQTGRPGPTDTRAAAELVVFADANGVATDFEALYAGAATSILRDPASLRIAVYVPDLYGQYQLVTEQPFVPAASALWSVHSLDTDALVADLEAERSARAAADAALGGRIDAELDRALAAEGALAVEVAAEVARAQDAEWALGESVSAVSASLASYQQRLAAPGVVNAPVNPLDFGQLKNVPPHAVTGYAAGPGISIAADLIALAAPYADGSAHDPRFVNASGDTVASLGVAGELCLGASCRTAWPTLTTTLESSSTSSCTCAPQASVTAYCCKFAWSNDPLGCLDGSLNWHPSQCGTSSHGATGVCSCQPQGSAACAAGVITGCATGTYDPGALACAGQAAPAWGQGWASADVYCNCDAGLDGICGVACTRSVQGSPVTLSGGPGVAVAVCGTLQ